MGARTGGAARTVHTTGHAPIKRTIAIARFFRARWPECPEATARHRRSNSALATKQEQ